MSRNQKLLMTIPSGSETLHARPVTAVNTDQHSTIRVMTRRGPTTSPHQPIGTSNRE